MTRKSRRNVLGGCVDSAEIGSRKRQWMDQSRLSWRDGTL